MDYLCSDEGTDFYIIGELREKIISWTKMEKPYRTDEEVAKAQSDPDYHKNTGIDKLYWISNLWSRFLH